MMVNCWLAPPISRCAAYVMKGLARATPGVAATLLYASAGMREDSLNGPPRPRSTTQRSASVLSISHTPSAMLPW